MKYQAVANHMGCEEYTVQAPTASQLAVMLEALTNEPWSEEDVVACCEHGGYERLECFVVFFNQDFARRP